MNADNEKRNFDFIRAYKLCEKELEVQLQYRGIGNSNIRRLKRILTAMKGVYYIAGDVVDWKSN